MRISKISIQGFRAFKDMTEISFGAFTTIVGKNDTGKSSILHTLDIFFNRLPDEDDFNRDQDADAPIVIQVSFADLPSLIQLEEGVNADWLTENLLDAQNNLTIRRIYLRKTPKKFKTTYIVEDFIDPQYQNLCSLKESELNELGKSLALDFKKSGRGITSKGKREAIRNVAIKRNLPKGIIEVEPTEAALKVLSYIPDFSLFKADASLSEEGTSFQKEFKDVVETAVEKIPEKKEIENGIETVIDEEIKKIHFFLFQHTDEVDIIKARPSFKWKDLVSFYLECKDKQGKEIAFAKRGSGLRRLLMVAYFQYLAQRDKSSDSLKDSIYGIEEPETYLHPGAQRILLDSFKDITDSSQVLVSSHSPVFAGSTDIENIILVTREAGVANVYQGSSLDLVKVADELGIESSDQIIGYKAVVFMDGPQDCDFINTVAKTLCESGKLPSTFEVKKIGILPGGGNNLKHWVTRKAIKGINRNYIVILDSDRKSPDEKISDEKLRLKSAIESEGGICFILRKREIENYLHPTVVKEKTGKEVEIGDFIDLKSIFDDKICGLIQHMSANQILEVDRYEDKGIEKHELLEICEAILNLA